MATILDCQTEEKKPHTEVEQAGDDKRQELPGTPSLLTTYNWALDRAEDSLETVMMTPHPDFKKKSSKVVSCVGTIQRTLELGYRLGMGVLHNFVIFRHAKNKSPYY